MRITETRLALVIAAALHAEATLSAAGAYPPVTVLICVTVLGIGTRIAARIYPKGRAKWARWYEERVGRIRMALRFDGISRDRVTTERVMRVEVRLRAAVPGLNRGTLVAGLTGPGRACEMRQTGLFAIATVTNLSRLGLGRSLADAVLAQKIGPTAIGGVAEMTFAAEGTRALLGDVGIQRERGQVGEAAGWRSEVL